MVFICENCSIQGSGWPHKPICPSCGGTVLIKTRHDPENDDLYKGTFVPLVEAAGEILSILHTFNHSHCELYVSYEIRDFLREYGFDKGFNYKVDPTLTCFEMNVR